MKTISIIATFVTSMVLMVAHAQMSTTSYCTRYNDFAQLRGTTSESTIVDGLLRHANDGTSNIVVLDTTCIGSQADYKYYIKMANLHNREHRSYKVKDESGKTAIVASTQCGLVFNHTGNDYWAITAHCSNSAPYDDALDVRSMTIELNHVVGGKWSTVASTQLVNEVNVDEGYNYICVQLAGHTIKVLAGKTNLNEVMSHDLTQDEIESIERHPHVKVGYIVGPGALTSIERAVLTVSTSDLSPTHSPITTQWTREALDRHFETSKNPFEGYWVYLDRDMEDTWLKMGGRYTIALVETSTGYDVIYIDGAQVKKSQWQAGMKKAEMKKTIFTDNFTGTWIDATFQPIDEDVYVTFESGVILTFKFPVYKSQMRFSKVL